LFESLNDKKQEQNRVNVHQIRFNKKFTVKRKHCRPSLKQIAGSVVSSNPEQIAFRTATLSNLPEDKKIYTL
jgi:hypothetical protein